MQLQIKMCRNNGFAFFAMLHSILLAPDLCEKLFSMDMLVYPSKGLHGAILIKRENMRLHYEIVHKGNICFWGK